MNIRQPVGERGAPEELRAKKHFDPVRRSREDMRRRDTARELGRMTRSGLNWRANVLKVGMKVRA